MGDAGVLNFINKDNQKFLQKQKLLREQEEFRESKARAKREKRQARLDALNPKPVVELICARLHRDYVPYIKYMTEGSKMPKVELYKQMKAKGLDPAVLDDPDMMVPKPKSEKEELGPMPVYPEGTKTMCAMVHPDYKLFIKSAEGCNKSQLASMKDRMIQMGLNPRALLDPLMPVPAPTDMTDAEIEDLEQDTKNIDANSQQDVVQLDDTSTSKSSKQFDSESYWEEAYDEQGYLYYYNSHTGESSWDPPLNFQVNVNNKNRKQNEPEKIVRPKAPVLAVAGAHAMTIKEAQRQNSWQNETIQPIKIRKANLNISQKSKFINAARKNVLENQLINRPKTPTGIKSMDPTKHGADDNGLKGKNNFGSSNSDWSIW